MLTLELILKYLKFVKIKKLNKLFLYLLGNNSKI